MKRLITIVSILFLIPIVMGVSTTEGEITNLGEIKLTPYGMITGTIIYELGEVTWYPEEIWIVSPGEDPDEYSSTGDVNRLSGEGEEKFGSKCETRIYSNEENKTAYKITSSNIINGTFCALVDDGEYEIITE